MVGSRFAGRDFDRESSPSSGATPRGANGPS